MIKIYTTNRNAHYAEAELDFVHKEHAEFGLIKIYPDEIRQEILGFGGAFTEASAYVWSQMGEEEKELLTNLYFGEKGNRYNFCRTHIQSCDFSLGNRCYVEGEDLGGFP